MILLSQIVTLAQAVAAPVQGATIAACPPAVEIVKALAWPLVAGAIALFLREPLRGFVTSLGARVTKLSVFKVELELASVEGTAPSVVLNQLRDTTQAAVADSAQSLFVQLEDTSPADYAVIDLGMGTEWITSRLFIAAALLERMRGLRGMVFVESREWMSEHLLAVASPAVVRWCLAGRYPWLELAYARATVAAVAGVAPGLPTPEPKAFVAAGSVITTEHGTLAGGRAATLAREFVSSLQDWSGNPMQSPAIEWVQLSGYRERATYVTPDLLRELLPVASFDQHMPEMRDDATSKRVRALFRRQGQLVALVDARGQFKRAVDRSALIEKAAAQLSEEPNA